MSRNFFVEMITPERVFYKDYIDSLVVETMDGILGVLAGHIPLVTALKPGAVRFLSDNKWLEAYVSEGFMEVRPDKTIILAQMIEWPDEIEENKVKREIERAQEVMRQNKSLREYQLSKAQLTRAFAMLRVKSRYRD